MQINRLFEMVYLLLNKESITAGEFARQFEVSTRTVYRDVELLSSAGIPIYMTKGKGGGISLLPDFVLNKALLTEAEKMDILSSLQAVKAVSLESVQQGGAATAHNAIRKLSSLFGNEENDWIEVDFSDWSDGEESTVFAMVKQAILRKQVIELNYYSKDGSAQRVVEPLKLCFKGQSWYVYGYCRLRKDFRFFKLRRIKDLAIREEQFDREIPARVFPEGSSAFAGEQFVTITLRLAPEMAYRVYDEYPEYEKLSDGSFLVKITMPKGAWIHHYLATFGEYCQVVAPEDIRLQVKHKLEKMLEQYS